MLRRAAAWRVLRRTLAEAWRPGWRHSGSAWRRPPQRSLRTSPPRVEAPPPPIKPALPTRWLIGDSTVRDGQDTGYNGRWGWGNPVAPFCDPGKIDVQNPALGGGRYDAAGQARTTATHVPAGEVFHADRAGAVVNAQCVVEGLKLDHSALVKYLRPGPPTGLHAPPLGTAW